MSFPWSVEGSSSSFTRWISVSIFPQSALSYLNGVSDMLLHISLVLISSALCSVEAMVLCFTLTPQEGFGIEEVDSGACMVRVWWDVQSLVRSVRETAY